MPAGRRREPALLVAIGTTSANNTYVGKGGRPAWAAPHVELGLLEMQSGRDGAARVALDVATELDPYNTRAAFSEFLLEEIESFEVLESENFILKYRAGEDAVVAKGMLGPHSVMSHAVPPQTGISGAAALICRATYVCLA